MVGGLVAKHTGLVLDSAHQPGLAEPGATLLKDYSRFGNDGTFPDGHPDWVRLPSGLWVLSFDGSSDVVEVAHAPSMNTLTAFTLETWLRRTAAFTDLNAYLFEKGLTRMTDDYEVYLTLATSRITFKVDKGGGTVSLTTTIADNTWTHLVVTFDSSLGSANMKAFFNGIVDGNTGDYATVITPNAKVLRIGARSATSTRLGGNMIFMRVYNHALLVGQILKHFTAERTWFGV